VDGWKPLVKSVLDGSAAHATQVSARQTTAAAPIDANARAAAVVASRPSQAWTSSGFVSSVVGATPPPFLTPPPPPPPRQPTTLLRRSPCHARKCVAYLWWSHLTPDRIAPRLRLQQRSRPRSLRSRQIHTPLRHISRRAPWRAVLDALCGPCTITDFGGLRDKKTLPRVYRRHQAFALSPV
jgi:hypothetical protein